MGAVLCCAGRKGRARGRMEPISPKKLDRKSEIFLDKAELLIAAVCRVVTSEVALTSLSLFSFARPTVTGLRPSPEKVSVDQLDKHGDWSLAEVTVPGERRRLFMHAYSVVLPTPAVSVDLEIWRRIKETFHANVFKLTTQTLVMRTREFGFHVMTGGKVYHWDARHKAFKVYNQYAAVFRNFGLRLVDNKLSFYDLSLDNCPFQVSEVLRSSPHVELSEPPHYDQHARRVLRFALVEGFGFFALYDSTGEGGMQTPVFFDSMKFADEFQMILAFLEIPHGRFTRMQTIVNGRHYPVHTENATFGLTHNFHYMYIYTMHAGTACRILNSNYGHIAVVGKSIVEMNKQILLKQTARYGRY